MPPGLARNCAYTISTGPSAGCQAGQNRGAPARWLRHGPLDVQASANLPDIVDDRTASKATVITRQSSVEHRHAWVDDAMITDAAPPSLGAADQELSLTGSPVAKEKNTSKGKAAAPS